MRQFPRSVWQGLGASLIALALAGCASPRQPAPVETRAPTPRAVTVAPSPPPAVEPAVTVEPGAGVLPGAEHAGKPGYYTVRPGDTMIRIGLDHGQNWRDIARWNNLENPNRLEVGQVLRVLPPDPSTTVVAQPVAPTAAEARPATPLASTTAAATAATTTAATPQPVGPSAAPPPAPAVPATPSPPAPPPTAAARDPEEDVAWVWPADGALGSGFDESRNKGVVILGKAGDPVVAAADGRVVYAGSGLRGYGNLVIVKHNNTYLSAYAHNQTLLVKEDQAVRRGQKIAEMGSSDAERVQLHFEIRRQGRPVDPVKLLPAR